MRIAHLSDLHLGHRAFDRSERGRNMRERDVSRAFLGAVERAIDLAPDLMVISGDILDRPDLPPGVLVPFAQALEEIHRKQPGLHVLAVAGLGDTPGGSDPGGLAVLDALPNVEAAVLEPRTVQIPDLSASVALVPHRAVARPKPPRIRPDPDAQWNVLVAYGAAAADGDTGLTVDVRVWDYVALGSEHSFRRVARHACYAGSLERVNTDPWREAGEKKGFVLFDTTTGAAEFHPVGGRPVVELAAIRITEDPREVNDRVRELVDGVPGGIDGKLVRLRIEGLAPDEQWVLDTDLLTSLRARAGYMEVLFGGLETPTPSTATRAVGSGAVR